MSEAHRTVPGIIRSSCWRTYMVSGKPGTSIAATEDPTYAGCMEMKAIARQNRTPFSYG